MKLLIFDFDGTIADTKAIYYHAIFGQLKSRGFSEKTISKAIDLGTSLRKMLHNLGLGFISRMIVQKRITKNVEKRIREVKKCRDVNSIKSIDEEKILITSSLKEFVVPILRHLNLKKDFNEVYGAEDFSDKAEFVREYLKKNNINKKECYYIGDRVADVKLAKKVGCISVIIAGKCAWNSRQELIRARPDFLLGDIAELKQVLERKI